MENRKCLHCGKILTGDYRKKFCTNSGIGNCKDAFHNRKRRALSRKKRRHNRRRYISREAYIEKIREERGWNPQWHPDLEDNCWGNHKHW